MSTSLSQGNTGQYTPTDPRYEPLRMVIGATMKRMLGANDGYGNDTMREAIMDELNELARNCEVAEGFLVAVSDAFSRLQELSKDQSRRHRVMREALIAGLSDIQSFYQRLE